MQQKFLKDALSIVIGKPGEEIVDLLNGTKYVNEFIIAKKLDTTINQTRNILYKLLDNGLISSIRKKDKKKGWYTYFWKIEVLKSLEFLREIFSKKIEQLEHNMKSRQSKQFYFCDRCKVEYSEENALLYNFTCPECGSLLSLKDNTKVVEDLKKEIDKIKKQREFLEQDITEERERLGKIRQKEIKKEEKEKKEERQKKALKKKKEKAKLEKTNPSAAKKKAPAKTKAAKPKAASKLKKPAKKTKKGKK